MTNSINPTASQIPIVLSTPGERVWTREIHELWTLLQDREHERQFIEAELEGMRPFWVKNSTG
jgi:hypothetical protein